LRYLLETCETTDGALALLARVPIQAAYNLTLLDRGGHAVTAHVGPDGPPAVRAAAVATNHPENVEWAEHAAATGSVEREERVLELLADPATNEDAFVEAFLAPPLYNTAYASGFGTLYTAVHRPADGSVEYRWPGVRWRQSFAAFEEGSRVVRYSAANVTV
jgi:predicted choloylglycine hydrolase